MTTTLIVFTAFLLDVWLGEPRRYHPLVGFGKLAQAIEQRNYADSILRGMGITLLLLLPFTFLITLIEFLPWSWVFDILLLYLAIGWDSLKVHAKRVQAALCVKNLPEARQHVSFMVSRDTTMLNQEEVTKATVESILENGNDAIFGAIFWFVIAGAPGVILYRLTNTLDAMWGYRNQRYFLFGRTAARLDDILNFIPARLTALSYAVMGQLNQALLCWKTQGTTWKSPNAGPVMAAGAGSLGILLGGPASYHGKLISRPVLGKGRAPGISDIDQALGLIRRAIFLWFMVLCTGVVFIEFVLSI